MSNVWSEVSGTTFGKLFNWPMDDGRPILCSSKEFTWRIGMVQIIKECKEILWAIQSSSLSHFFVKEKALLTKNKDETGDETPHLISPTKYIKIFWLAVQTLHTGQPRVTSSSHYWSQKSWVVGCRVGILIYPLLPRPAYFWWSGLPPSRFLNPR